MWQHFLNLLIQGIGVEPKTMWDLSICEEYTPASFKCRCENIHAP